MCRGPLTLETRTCQPYEEIADLLASHALFPLLMLYTLALAPNPLGTVLPSLGGTIHPWIAFPE